MEAKKRARLKKAGWTVGTVQEFLDLDDAEMAMIEVRVQLAQALKDRRRKLKVSQITFAERIGSSQSRVAKMEAGDPSVSLDLLMKALLVSGATPKQLGRVIAKTEQAA